MSDINVLQSHLKIVIRDSVDADVITQSLSKVSQVGDWTLFESKIAGSSFSNLFPIGSNFKVAIKYDFISTTEKIWVDDVRIQPTDAQMTAYVYDVNSLKLLTTFDDQHFGLYYQYNGEGKLVRKIIETEKGKKTLKETQYNTPLVAR